MFDGLAEGGGGDGMRHFDWKKGAEEPAAPDGAAPRILLCFDSHIHLVESSHRAFEKWRQDLEDDWRLVRFFFSNPITRNKLTSWEKNVDDFPHEENTQSFHF